METKILTLFTILCISQLARSYDTPCNTVLDSLNGTLEYKVHNKLKPGERCVWTIRHANNLSTPSYFKFHKLSSGFQETEAQLTIHTINDDGPRGNALLGRMKGPQRVDLAGDVAIVVLTVSDMCGKYQGSHCKGFVLDFEIVLEDRSGPVLSGTSTMLTNQTATYHHELDVHEKNLKEITTLVIYADGSSNADKINLQFNGKIGKYKQSSWLEVYHLVDNKLQLFGEYEGGSSEHFIKHQSGPVSVDEFALVLYRYRNRYDVKHGFKLYWEITI